MPVGMDKAPNTLPKGAQQLWVDTFNGSLENCEGTTAECDERAAKIAWSQIRKDYRKVKDQWIAQKSEAYHDVLLTITKASLQPDGSVRWQAVASDTGKDKADERTSVDLFQDWIDRVTYKADVGYLPEPRMPFLGVSHYPALDGYGEGGATYRMFIDGNTFKADGVFNLDRPVGEILLDEIKTELAFIKKGGDVEKPIRISAGWWDIQHYHEDIRYLFTRENLIDKCPICQKGQTTDKIYKAGQLDHFAATRVPMNIRTSLELKSMAKKITRKEDAESIIGPELAEEMENRSRMVGKSEADDELPSAMVTRADDMKSGHFMREMREKKKMKRAEVAKQLGLEDRELEALEDDEMDIEMMGEVSVALKMSDEEKEKMLARFGKKRRKEPPTHKAATKTVGDEKFPSGDFLVVEDPEKPTTWHLQVRRHGEVDRGLMGNAWAALHKGFRGNPYKGPDKQGAIQQLTKLYKDEEAPLPTEKMDYDDIGGGTVTMPMMLPLGGATSIKEAEGYIEAQEKMDKMYSFWDMLQIAFHNIEMAHKEEIPDKLKAVSNLFREMAGKIDTLKAGLSDAFLIQESTAAYEDYEADTADYITDEVEIMSETIQTEHPADQMKTVIDQAVANKSLSRPDQETAVQEALNSYAQSVQTQLDEANPAPQGEQIAQAIKGALAEVLTPFTEQMGLLAAKMNQQAPQPQGEGLQQVYVPQQKSMSAPAQVPQPVQGDGGQGHHISPVIGKPSPLTDIIRKSVGLHN